MDTFNDRDAELAAMAAGGMAGARQFSSATEAVEYYTARAAAEAEFALHKFYVDAVHSQTEGLVRYADLLRAAIIEIAKIDPEEKAAVYRVS